MIREVLSILADVFRGGRCTYCGGRSRNLAQHQWFDHGDEIVREARR
jgi:hypothetical protein